MTSGILSHESLYNLGCVLNLPLSGKDGSITRDYSPPHGKDITAVGDVKQILPFTGAGIGIFDGTNSYLTVPHSTDLVFTGGDATIEFWFYPNEASVNKLILGFVHPTTAVGWYFGYASNRIYFTTNNNSSQISPAENSNPYLNWYHVAVVRYNGVISLYINGVSVGTPYTGELQDYDTELYIAQYQAKAAYYLKCNLSELRITKGVALYTANFTPPRRQLESDANTKLLLHFKGSGTSFIDSSASNHTITPSGDGKQIYSPVEGAGVGYFDGNGDYLTTPDHDDWYMSGDYTISFWMKRYVVQTTTQEGLIGQHIASGNGNPRNIIAINTNGTLLFYDYTQGGIFSTSIAISDTNWHYIQYIRLAGTLYAHIDGVQCGSIAYAIPSNNTNILYIGYGRSSEGNAVYFNGYLSEIVISKGIARSITVPTQPFQPDPYTKLLLHFDNFTSPTKFIDASRSSLPHHATITGTCAIRGGKDGRSVMYFDGTGDYLSIADSEDWNFGSGDFTYTTWINPTANSNYIFFGQNTSTDGFFIQLQVTGEIRFQMYLSSAAVITLTTASNLIVAGSWHFVALRKSGSVYTLYLNGVQVATGTSATPYINVSAIVSIGCQYISSVGYPVTGYIRDVMFFKGTALDINQLSQIMQSTDPR